MYVYDVQLFCVILLFIWNCFMLEGERAIKNPSGPLEKKMTRYVL